MDKVTTKKKIENFWFYYKWYVIGFIFLAVVTVVGIRSCNRKVSPDLYLLYARDVTGPSMQQTELEAWLGKMSDDLNEDGEKTASVLTTVTNDQWNSVTSSALLVQVNSGDAVLYLLTEKNYNLLHQNNVLQDLSDLGESAYLKDDRYCITKSGVLEALPTFTGEQELFLCLRKIEGTTHEQKAGIEKQEQLAKKVIMEIISKEKSK